MKTLAIVLCVLSLGLLPASDSLADQRGPTLKDARIEGSLVTAYALNEHLNPFRIDVRARNGEVTLTGTVESDIDRDLAGEIAQGMGGVKNVDNRLKVDKKAGHGKSNGTGFAQTVRDATLTASVKAKLLADGNVHGTDIAVDTDNGEVTLRGKVASEEQKELAGSIAVNTDGVREVHNRLSVH